MKVGITGHQERDGIDWRWVRAQIDHIIAGIPRPIIGYSSLAAGTDQLFALSLLAQGAVVRAVIPLSGYESYFRPDSLEIYKRLLRQSERIDLPEGHHGPEEAFYRAGVYVAASSELMLAVWDEKPAKGFGGTADIVRFCRKQKIPVIVINPLCQTVTTP